MYKLKTETDPAWADHVIDHFDEFLVNHASCERKVGAAAKHFAVRYHDKPELIDKMLELAREELEHFHQVFRLLRERGGTLGPDQKDPYVNGLLSEAKSGGPQRLLDRLLVGSIFEYRGCERFALLYRRLRARDANPELVEFYKDLAADDSRHRQVFLDLAERYFDKETVDQRLEEFLEIEDQLMNELPLRATLY
mgnify:CR=1 FL=1